MGIDRNLEQNITTEGISICNRVAWICLIHPQWGRLGLVGIYGPNDTRDRTALWRSLFFNLMDTFSPTRGHLRYSWDGMHLHIHNPANANSLGSRNLCQLDRVYWAEARGGQVACQSLILPGFSFSDQAPIWAKLTSSETLRRPSRFRMNASHFNNVVYKDRIKAMWQAVMQTGMSRERTPSSHLISVFRRQEKLTNVGAKDSPRREDCGWKCSKPGCSGHNWPLTARPIVRPARWNC